MGIETPNNQPQPDFFDESGNVVAPEETPDETFKRLFGYNPRPYGLKKPEQILDFIRTYEGASQAEVNSALAGLAREEDAGLDYTKR